MKGRKEIVESRRADEVIINSNVAAWLGVCEVEVEVDYFFRLDVGLLTDHIDQSSVMFSEDFCIFGVFFFDQRAIDIGREQRSQFGFGIGIEFTPFGSEVDREVGDFQDGP